MRKVTVEITINKPIDQVWDMWTTPEHIMNWNFATTEWHCPRAVHELKVGGKLKYHMAAKDGSMAFDYVGTFSSVVEKELLEHTLEDGRKVSVMFDDKEGKTLVKESFEVEDENSIDTQRQGWQAILDNFKSYVESK